MPSKEISFWINERWYDALSKHLKNETLCRLFEGTGTNGVIFQFIIPKRTYNNTVIKRYTHSESGAGTWIAKLFNSPQRGN